MHNPSDMPNICITRQVSVSNASSSAAGMLPSTQVIACIEPSASISSGRRSTTVAIGGEMSMCVIGTRRATAAGG
jgi:hypothetical protein